MLDFLQVAQRQDKALWVSLTIPDQEQSAKGQGHISRGHMAAAFTQGLPYPWGCWPAQPCLLPVYKALLRDEPLTLLTGDSSMEPGLGSVDGWGDRETDRQSL